MGPDQYFPPSCRVEFRIGCTSQASARALCTSIKNDDTLKQNFSKLPKIAPPPRFTIYSATAIPEICLWLKAKVSNILDLDYILNNPLLTLFKFLSH